MPACCYLKKYLGTKTICTGKSKGNSCKNKTVPDYKDCYKYPLSDGKCPNSYSSYYAYFYCEDSKCGFEEESFEEVFESEEST